MDRPERPERPEHLGPMARSLVEMFAELTLGQQRRVFAMLREVLEANEQAVVLAEGGTASGTQGGQPSR